MRVQITSGLRSSSRPGFTGYWTFWRGLVVAFAAFAVMTGFEMPDLKARSEIQGAVQTVDRNLKGDRLPSAAAPRGTVSDEKLPLGCEPLVSPFVSRQLARIASRCVS
jgi:hypothetical protein